jgi:hypothetical protein
MFSKLIRWSARLAGSAFAILWIVMFFTNCIASTEVAHAGKYMGYDKFRLTLIWISMIGIFISWINEFIGGLLILIPSLVLLAMHPGMIMSRMVLLPAFGFMFLYSYWRGRPDNGA